jgi:glycosyltransferase involved in cell wall biosynthesis
LPYILLNKKVKLINSQITSAPPKISYLEKKINAINFYFSDRVLSNSEAGILAYHPPKEKSLVIYNGMNFSRFKNLTDVNMIKEKFNMKFKYTVIMVATYSKNKDYQKFFRVGMALNKIRKDTMFIGIGFYDSRDPKLFTDCVNLVRKHPNLKPLPGTSNVESLVNVCDIGILFSNTEVHGEGISNSIIEYMALGKPVIANDAGGTKEVVIDGENGYLIQDETDDQIAILIDGLLNDPEKMRKMGDYSKKRIVEDFSLTRMGREFENVYKDLL